MQTLHRNNWRVCTEGTARPIRLAYFPMTPNEMVVLMAWPDRTCGRAVEDRDLPGEARDFDACLAAAAEKVMDLHPSTDTSSLFPDGLRRHTLAN